MTVGVSVPRHAELVMFRIILWIWAGLKPGLYRAKRQPFASAQDSYIVALRAQWSWDMPTISCVGGDLRRRAAIFESSLGTK